MLERTEDRFDPNLVVEEFETLTKDALTVQKETLKKILEENGETEYLKKWGLNGRIDSDTFKSLVPLVTHKDLEPFIHRTADGDNPSILTAKPITTISLSSGTTQGKPKFVPFNDELMENTMQIIKTSFAFRNREYPIENGKALQFIYGSKQFKTKGGLAAGTATTNVYLNEKFKKTMQAMQTPCCSPDEVIFGPEFHQSLYCHLLCGLIFRNEVQVVSSTFAHSIVHAFRTFEQLWEELVIDIEEGVLSSRITVPSIRLAISKLLRADPESANVIRSKCVGLSNWYGLIQELFPNTKYIYGIMTGSMEPYLLKLRHYAGSLPLLSADYGASEGWIGANVNPKLPPELTTFAVLPNIGFFEFIPLKEELNVVPAPIGLTEVQVGEEYEIVITTFAGTALSAVSSNPTYLKSDIIINCGSGGISTTVNGRECIGDKNKKSTSFMQIKGTSTISSSTHKLISGDPVIHKTARISAAQFRYSLHLNTGHKILRLHFNPTPYKGFKKFNDLFTVEAGQFTLLDNFSASLTAQALAVNTFTKEFYLSVTENQPLNITFSPLSKDKTYAFVNGIEIISVPEHLVYFHGQDNEAKVIGQKYVLYVDNNTAIEIIHRLNVQQDSASSDNELGMSGMWGAVKKQHANENRNLTWKRSVDIGFRYLIRIYFSEIGLKMAETGHMPFKILINELLADTIKDIVKERDENGSLLYRDYMVAMKGRKQDSRRDISISLQSNNDILDGHVIIKGFEILKLSNTENSLASPNPFPLARNVHPSWIRWNLIPVLSYKDAISGVTVLLIALVNIIVHMLSQISEAKYREVDNVNKPSARAERHCRRFTLAEIRSATRNFSDAFFIARGGFGNVYKAVIDDGKQTVAIKRLNIYSMQGSREFLTEIEALSELRHINLVPLIGYCNERGEMILVYEYMPGGTLADQLYKLARKNGNSSSLTWKQRLNICIGAGRGLDYLHTGHRIIHRDVKSSNILLDESLEAKVADFGLAKLEDRSKLQSHVSTNVRGTFGYFDPYYVRTHKLSRKSDTYAFGVVLLEVLCGRAAVDKMAGEEKRSLTIWVQEKIRKGEVSDIVDSYLIGEILPNSFKVFVEVAQKCLHDEPTKRPTMAQVVVQLEFALGQQDVINSFMPNQETIGAREISPPNDETKSLIGTEQVTIVHERSTGDKDARKLKMNKPFQFSPWDGLWQQKLIAPRAFY